MRQRLALAACLLCVAFSTEAQTDTTVVTMSDGVELATDLWLPFGFGDFDTVLLRTPYGRIGLGDFCLAFNLAGYACVTQDSRGRFDSGGENRVFRAEGDDGRETVAWIGDQFWSSGRIAAFGFSALGNNVYALLPEADAALQTAISVVATPDIYNYAFLQGGALREALVVNWLEGIDAYPAFFDEMMQHRVYDDWWSEVDDADGHAAVSVPVLHMGGWYDIFSQGTLDAFAGQQELSGGGAAGKHKLIIGPWAHTTVTTNVAGEAIYPENATVNLIDILLLWFERWLEGRPNAVDEWPPVQAYLMGPMLQSEFGNRWLALESWPPAAETLALYLGSDGRLDARGTAAGERQLRMDPDDPVPTLGGANLADELVVDGRPMGAGPFDQRPIEDHGDLVIFQTDVAARPLSFVGRLGATLWLRPDTPDLDLAVRLSDVYPDGRSMLIADGIARARMRCARELECFLEPGVPVEIEVDLWSTAYVLAPGHRLRISISGSNHPRFEVNPNGGGDLDQPASDRTIARPVLLTGPDYPSRLELPRIDEPRPVDGRAHPAQRRSFRGFLKSEVN